MSNVGEEETAKEATCPSKGRGKSGASAVHGCHSSLESKSIPFPTPVLLTMYPLWLHLNIFRGDAIGACKQVALRKTMTGTIKDSLRAIVHLDEA